MNRLRALLNVHRHEAFPITLLFVYLTLVFTAYIIAKAVRDALFLHEFSARNLPYLYIGVAIVIAVFVSAYIRLSYRFTQPVLVSGTIGFFMITAVALWWAIRAQWTPVAVVYYLWVNIVGIIVIAQVWTIATTVLSTEQAKRLFLPLCGGGVLGGLLGGVIAAAGVRYTGTDNLILVSAGLLGLAIPLVHLLAGHYSNQKRNLDVQSTAVDEASPIGGALKITLRSRYLRLIAALLALSAIVTLITDFQFKTITQEYFQSKDAMTAFFGSFYANVGLVSFLAQILAGSRLFARYRGRLALMFLPLTLLGGTAALLAFPTMLWTGVFLKGSEGVLRSSIDKSTMEMLYIPVASEMKVQIKAVIDMLIQRFSDATGGIVLLIMTQALGFGLVGVGIFNVGLLLIWVWVARETRREYQAAVRRKAQPVELPAEPCTPTLEAPRTA